MDFSELVESWLDNLIGSNILYVSGKNTVKILSYDKKSIVVSRENKEVNITRERIDRVYNELQKGAPIHVDTFLSGGGNDRTIIETVLANFPSIGFMKGSTGRNKAPHKVIQLLSENVHDIGTTLDISNESYSHLVIRTQASKVAHLQLPKPFLLLAGISGTGKTRFVREQVRASGSLTENYCLTSVRPDWHEPSDLQGYVSRLKGKAEYVSTDVIEFIGKSWRAIIDSDLLVSEQADENDELKLVVQGDSNSLATILPYWLCLDEMNLAPVEQYFADYLSVLETREWQWTGNDFIYGCDALLSASTVSHPDYTESLRKQLGFENAKYDNAWPLFKKYGIGIPFNLIVAGTVNMDETTHGFSRKVIDRALSFDFGEFFPNEIDDFFEPIKLPRPLSFPIYSQAKYKQFETVEADSDAQKTTEFFKAVNRVLKGTAFELAFRAFNELCLSVISFNPKSEQELQAVFDDFLMCKVLPRIEGDEDKLTSHKGNLLELLVPVLESELKDIWQNPRPDLLRKYKESDDKVVETSCRSSKKIEAMTTQLTSGFTSFWP